MGFDEDGRDADRHRRAGERRHEAPVAARGAAEAAGLEYDQLMHKLINLGMGYRLRGQA